MNTLSKFLLSSAALFASAGATVADIHGNALGSSTTITNPDTSGTLNTTSDQDWFRINITRAGRVFLYTSGTTDTYLSIYDHAGNIIESDNNDGAGYNARLNRVYQPGTYYLRIVNGGNGALTGSYTLHFRAPQNAIPVDGPNHADSIPVLGDLQYFKFTIASAGLNYFYTLGQTDTYLSLYNHAGGIIESDDNDWKNDNAMIDRKMQPGTYYLVVQSGGSGNLTGGYTLAHRNPDHAVPFDRANLDASIHTYGDLDYYRLDITTAGPAWLFTNGNTDTYLSLFDHAGNIIESDDDDWEGYNSSIMRSLGAGTYYLVLRDGGQGNLTGSYTLSRRDAATAVGLTSQGSSTHSLGKPGDLDLFRFSTTGGLVTLQSAGATDTYARLYNASGSIIESDDNDGGNGNFHIDRTLAAGTYYLRISGSSLSLHTGAYILQTSFNSAGLSALSEPVTAGDASGGTHELQITSNTGWTAANIPAWASLSQTSGSGNTTVQLILEPNTTGTTRRATITIGGVQHLIEQSNTSSSMDVDIMPGIILLVPTEPGRSYRVDGSRNLSQWHSTGVVITGDGTTRTVSFPSSAGAKYYRVVAQ